MDQFLLDNSSRYLELVDGFQPMAKNKGDVGVNEDIVIATRLRPMLPDEIENGMVPGIFPRKSNSSFVDLHELRKTVRGSPALNSFSFGLDRVFTADDSTETVFEELVQPLVRWAWGGGVSTMFAYGQTGSGKTFTVSGLQSLAAKSLMSGSMDGSRRIFLSIIELAGNSAFDLLNSRKPISILEDSFGSTHLAGAFEHAVDDIAAVLASIEHAASFRRTASTQKNDASSRSHAICRIRIENPSLPQADDGLLYLIDLAGSEAARDVTQHTAERMKEAREINASLAVLKDCIRGRAMHDPVAFRGTGKGPQGNRSAKTKTHIPFRQTALTRVLKHVFDPSTERSCRTVVVACVNPSLADVGASKNTLRYAEMLRVPVPKAEAPRYDPAKPATWSNGQLREWVQKNSGSPAVSAEVLAPHEAGSQLLRLPVPEFLTRCMKTPGVTAEQAQAFHAKFWRLFVDSRGPAQQDMSEKKEFALKSKNSYGLSSQDQRPEMADVPFRERIRPGMVVAYGSPEDKSRNLAVVLSREGSGGETGNTGSTGKTRYTCARVSPGVMPGAFEVYLWNQVEVDINTMYAEVLLEYDMATRYYYETL